MWDQHVFLILWPLCSLIQYCLRLVIHCGLVFPMDSTCFCQMSLLVGLFYWVAVVLGSLGNNWQVSGWFIYWARQTDVKKQKDLVQLLVWQVLTNHTDPTWGCEWGWWLVVIDPAHGCRFNKVQRLHGVLMWQVLIISQTHKMLMERKKVIWPIISESSWFKTNPARSVSLSFHLFLFYEGCCARSPQNKQVINTGSVLFLIALIHIRLDIFSSHWVIEERL